MVHGHHGHHGHAGHVGHVGHVGHTGHVGHMGMRHHHRTYGGGNYRGGVGMDLSAPGAKLRCCAIGMIVASIFLIFIGAVLTGIGYDATWSDPFFGTSPMRVLGPMFLAAGIIMICIGVALIVVHSRSGYGITQGQVMQPAQPVVAGSYVSQPTVVAGVPPPAAGMNVNTPYPASVATYPPAPGNVTPYFPQQGQPNIGYQTDGGTVYQTGYGTNLSTSGGQPIPPPTDSKLQPAAPPSAPPPEYSEVMKEKQ